MWLVDGAAKMVTRLPRQEAPTHPLTPYEQVGAPMEFHTCEIVEESDGSHLMIRGPEGFWVMSGALLEVN